LEVHVQNCEYAFILFIHATVRDPIVRIMDVSRRPWHSRSMQKSSSMRRLCLALLLSQALAVQALVLAWSGAQAAVPSEAAFTLICKGALSDGRAGDTAPNPQHGLHHDCLSVCASGFSAVEPGQFALALVWRNASRSDEVLRDSGSLVAITTQVFSARAPPKLVV
jgi:hypothetical protein